MNPLNTLVCRVVPTWALLLLPALTTATSLEGGRCIAPAKPGGGFDLTCQFVRDALQTSGQTRRPLDIHYQPGGIGALAFRNTVAQQTPSNRTVVAFSSGSLLNLAQGRFGPHRPQDVHWLAVIGIDHGVIAVRADSPYKTLNHLLDALRTNPNAVIFGAGGSIGSQDWMKAALLARAAGVSHKSMRFVAFEGGGEALTALTGDHVQVLAADAAEVGRFLNQGKAVRVPVAHCARFVHGTWTARTRPQGLDQRPQAGNRPPIDGPRTGRLRVGAHLDQRPRIGQLDPNSGHLLPEAGIRAGSDPAVILLPDLPTHRSVRNCHSSGNSTVSSILRK
jgi:putative tricarboxylic transport membrane protein